MDARQALALARGVETVAVAAKTAIATYIHETREAAEVDRAVARHPAGKARPPRVLRPEERP